MLLQLVKFVNIVDLNIPGSKVKYLEGSHIRGIKKGTVRQNLFLCFFLLLEDVLQTPESKLSIAVEQEVV